MKALVKYGMGRESMEIREVPIPEITDGEVLIKVKAVGICGSDVHAMYDERKVAIPVILGHEFCGIVEKTCGDCGDVKVGDWVTGIPAAYNCGKCHFCKDGEVTLCPEHKSVGVMRDGGMAEYLVTRAAFTYKIPDEVEDKLVYAAAEPLACVVRGIYERIDVKPGDVAVVSGPGTIGLFAVQALKARGAYVIISGLPIDAHRLELAKKLGADETVQSFEELEKAVYANNPEGADIVCECSGAAPSLKNCFNVIKTHGTLLQIGMFGGEIKVDFNKIFEKELYVTSTNSTATTTWDITMKLLNEKKIDLAPIISLRLPLDEWEKGFDATIDKSAYKVILIP